MQHKQRMRNASNSYHFLIDVHYENYHNYHQPKIYDCLLVADVMKKGKKGWYILKLLAKGFLFMCL